VRIRDEMRMTIQAYQNLYESALSYGMRKALQGENKHAEYNSKINDLTSETTALEKEVKGIEDTIKKLNKDDEDEQVRNKKDHEDEIAKIKNKIKTFRETLEAKLSGEEKKKKQEADRKEEERKKRKEAKEKEKAAKQSGAA
jgi:dynein light intermediate chain, axonemal